MEHQYNGADFANRLKELRKQKGLSRKQLSEQAEISVYAVAKYESGKDCRGLDNLIRLADFYDVSANFLLFGKDLFAEKRSLMKN